MIVIPNNFDNIKGTSFTDSIVRAPHLVGNPSRKEAKRNLINTLSMHEPQSITYKQMLSDRRVLIAVVSAAAAMMQ